MSLFKRPESLKEVYGQKEITSFLSYVLQNPMSAPHYFLLSGQFGAGKTTIARAFAKDLLKENYNQSFIEIDSTSTRVLSDFQNLKSVIFSVAPSYKVVLFDECHKLGDLQSDLLKILEDFYGKVFIFFCTTEPDKLDKTFVSRLFDFQIHSFSQKELIKFANLALKKEGKELPDSIISIAASISSGSIRNLLKNLQIALIEGQDSFLQNHCKSLFLLRDYFYNPEADTSELITAPREIPSPVLKDLFILTFHQILAKFPGAYTKKVTYPLCQQYFQLQSFIKDSEDFYLFLDYFRRKNILPILIPEGANG